MAETVTVQRSSELLQKVRKKDEKLMKIRIRRILIPTLFCLSVACLVEIPMGHVTLFGEAAVLWDTLFRAILAVPMLVHFYKEDAVFRGEENWSFKRAALCIVTGFFLSLLFRFVTAAMGDMDYGKAEGALLSGDFLLQSLVLLVASPLLEELFFRGILYMRFKELFSPVTAGFLSAAFFGLYHGNVSQGIYGFFMGLILAYSMEVCRTVKAPVLIHGAANLAALIVVKFALLS